MKFVVGDKVQKVGGDYTFVGIHRERAAERDLAEWDAEIEAEFQRTVRGAKAAGKRKGKVPYVRLPLWFASAAAKATNTRKALVWIWLVRLAFENQSLEFSVPNARLKEFGVGRTTKLRVLRELEAAGLIIVTCRSRKAIRVALICI